jgi:hypothetical protein
MTKILVEDPDLREQIVSYIELQGHEIGEDTAISVTLPGTAKTPQKCASGSGIMTSGGRFAPGYDAKLKAALYAIIRGTLDKVPAELKPNDETGVVGPMYRPLDEWTPEEASRVLEVNGWPQPTIKVKKVKPPKDEETNSDGEASTGASTRKGRKRAAAAANEAEAEVDATV